jgi:hypothetical protein
LASHMEIFILGCEWDLNFLRCFVSQTIQNIFEIWILKKNLPFLNFEKITKTVHYLGLTYGKFHSGIWMLKIWFTWHGMTHTRHVTRQYWTTSWRICGRKEKRTVV